MQQSYEQQFPGQTAYTQQYPNQVAHPQQFQNQQSYGQYGQQAPGQTAYAQQVNQNFSPQTQQQYQYLQQNQQPVSNQQAFCQQVQQSAPYGQQPVQLVYGQQGVNQQMQAQQMAISVLGAQYCSQGEQIFFVNEKWNSLSGDDFAILDSRQQAVFKMDSSAFSIQQKRVLKNMRGHPVCSLKKKASKPPSTRYIYSCQNSKFAFYVNDNRRQEIGTDHTSTYISLPSSTA